ncbi:TetR/AcrR family transcriptional regulator [Hoeflea prorocentri]|uniref:TetR/AcrR family transcriptional regulator n=1 Tax=Hoeflea prorocentri TaxID=1922333 RepID=A0A9X3UL58_9HYPH|nr:TetR/AcrR family transcriptional regulator [Hoeflea prorocentri]MCY6383283.1 TetR/AcrR family transcriptional regulator [Hoeflea prorocentri]MDA5401083.1 TetR/AcrR family transcriptional regulator [Hoeflea prorocentri]
MSKRGDMRRRRLLAAAASRFWHQGYGSTSLADIARDAEVPLGNVYYYFRTKQDIAAGVADIFVAETQTMLEEVAEAESDPRRRVISLLRRLSQSSRSRVEHGCPISLAVRDFKADAPQAASRAAQSFELLTGFIGRELQRTGSRPSVALAKAREIIVEWQGGISLAHALGDATVLAESFRRAEQRLLKV